MNSTHSHSTPAHSRTRNSHKNDARICAGRSAKAAAKRRRRTHKKSRTPACGWAAYNQQLVKRGDLTILIDPELLHENVWFATSPKKAKDGAPFVYSDAAVRAVLNLAAAFHQGLRQAEGLCQGVFKLMGVNLPVPDYTTLCRRRKRLKMRLPKALRFDGRPRCIAIDSTGFLTYEPSAWRRRSKKVGGHAVVLPRRRWRKAHLMIDTETMEI